MQDKLEKGLYSSPKEFKHDVNLVWNNCMTYNAVRELAPPLLPLLGVAGP